MFILAFFFFLKIIVKFKDMQNQKDVPLICKLVQKAAFFSSSDFET